MAYARNVDDWKVQQILGLSYIYHHITTLADTEHRYMLFDVVKSKGRAPP